ncbi:protein phosphatase 2C domain-containing protein [Glycomyces sp. NPDC047369]
MRIRAATDPGAAARPNEDHYLVDDGRGIVVLADGATARTDTGCEHGTAWYAQTLTAQTAAAATGSEALRFALLDAIEATAGAHSGCDLTHPGTPSATVAAVRTRSADAVEVLVLGDATVIVATDAGTQVHTQRIDHIAAAERAAACALPIGDPSREDLLVAMKEVMHAHRNAEGGYWVAATDPAAAYRAYSRIVPARGLRQILLLSDGAAALSEVYSATDAPGLVALALAEGPESIINQVRAIEADDPYARQYPRTKRSDDATAILIDYTSSEEPGDATT